MSDYLIEQIVDDTTKRVLIEGSIDYMAQSIINLTLRAHASFKAGLDISSYIEISDQLFYDLSTTFFEYSTYFKGDPQIVYWYYALMLNDEFKVKSKMEIPLYVQITKEFELGAELCAQFTSGNSIIVRRDANVVQYYNSLFDEFRTMLHIPFS